MVCAVADERHLGEEEEMLGGMRATEKDITSHRLRPIDFRLWCRHGGSNRI